MWQEGGIMSDMNVHISIIGINVIDLRKFVSADKDFSIPFMPYKGLVLEFGDAEFACEVTVPSSLRWFVEGNCWQVDASGEDFELALGTSDHYNDKYDYYIRDRVDGKSCLRQFCYDCKYDEKRNQIYYDIDWLLSNMKRIGWGIEMFDTGVEFFNTEILPAQHKPDCPTLYEQAEK